MPGGGHEKSIATAIASRFPNSRVFSVGELKAFNLNVISAQTIVVYGFPSKTEFADAAAESVIAKQAEFKAACDARKTTGRMIVLASGELDFTGLTRKGELEKNFNSGRLTREGVQKI